MSGKILCQSGHDYDVRLFHHMGLTIPYAQYVNYGSRRGTDFAKVRSTSGTRRDGHARITTLHANRARRTFAGQEADRPSLSYERRDWQRRASLGKAAARATENGIVTRRVANRSINSLSPKYRFRAQRPGSHLQHRENARKSGDQRCRTSRKREAHL